MSLRQSLVAVSMVMSVSSCAQLFQALKGSTQADVDAAFAKGDVETLDAICNGKRPAEPSPRNNACVAYRRLTQKAALASASCGSIVSAYREARGASSAAEQLSVGMRMAECGHYKELFEVVAHWGNGDESVNMLIAIEAAGHPVEAQWLAYLQAHQGPNFFRLENKAHIKFALDHIGKWLIRKGHLGHCTATVAAVSDANPTAKVWVMPYLKETRCTAGLPVLVDNLLSNDAQERAWACNALGEIGDRSVLEPVTVVAESDTYYEVREEDRDGRIWGVKVHPVQEACRAAAGKLKIKRQARVSQRTGRG